MEEIDETIMAKVCNRIAEEVGLPKQEIKTDWIPPKKYGLANADIIIPSYYNIHKNPEKLFHLNFLDIIKDDIRNFRKLNEYQLDYIKNLSKEDAYEIILIYDKCFGTIEETFTK